MQEFLNPIAEQDRPDSGVLVTPRLAYEIKDYHKFYCPDYDCIDKGRNLIVKKSKNDNHFFSHKPGCGHDIRPETLLHKLAVQWFIGKNEYELPEYVFADKRLASQIVKLEPTKTECEFRKLKRIIPDVKLVTTNSFEFAIEIVVTNDISDSKAKLIEEFGLPTIRVNLIHFFNQNKSECRTNYDFIQKHLPTLLTDFKLKSWAIPPKLNDLLGKFEVDDILIPVKPSTNANSGCMLILVATCFAFVLGGVLIVKQLLAI